MHPWSWPSATVRMGVLVLVQIATVALGHDPAPTVVDVIAFLPFGLLFDALPGFVYVGMIRTWAGTVVAGVAIVAVQLALFAYVSELGRTSSTAGFGLMALPVLLLVPVLGVWLWERRSTPTATPPTARRSNGRA